MRSRLLQTSVLVALWMLPRPAYGFVSEIWGYVKQYQLGIDYTSTNNSVTTTYDTPKTGATDATDCHDVPGQTTVQNCGINMQAGSASGFGLILQQAFKRQGFFYLKPDLDFGLDYLSGKLDPTQLAAQQAAGLPLNQLQFQLASLAIKPTLTFGITPNKWPDLLISIGPEAQLAFGRVSLNNQARDVAVVTSSDSLIAAFIQVEIVVWRFGKGALSFFKSNEYTGDGRGTTLYPGTVGTISNVRGDFSHTVGGDFAGFGGKLVFNWPN